MRHIFGALLITCLALNAAVVEACFAPADAKPSSTASEVLLPPRPVPSVVYALGAYDVYFSPSHLAEAIKQRGSAWFDGAALAKRLQAQLPLISDLNISTLLNEMAPAVPLPGAGPQEVRTHDRYWSSLKIQMGFAAADLIEAGHAAIVKRNTDEALTALTLVKFNEVCHGGRRFVVGEEELLQTVDWIS